MSDVFVKSLEWLQSAVIVERIGWLLAHSVWQFAAVALLALLLDRERSTSWNCQMAWPSNSSAWQRYRKIFHGSE